MGVIATFLIMGGGVMAVCVMALSNRKARKLFNKYLWTVNDDDNNDKHEQ